MELTLLVELTQAAAAAIVEEGVVMGEVSVFELDRTQYLLNNSPLDGREKSSFIRRQIECVIQRIHSMITEIV